MRVSGEVGSGRPDTQTVNRPYVEKQGLRSSGSHKCIELLRSVLNEMSLRTWSGGVPEGGLRGGRFGGSSGVVSGVLPGSFRGRSGNVRGGVLLFIWATLG